MGSNKGVWGLDHLPQPPTLLNIRPMLFRFSLHTICHHECQHWSLNLSYHIRKLVVKVTSLMAAAQEAPPSDPPYPPHEDTTPHSNSVSPHHLHIFIILLQKKIKISDAVSPPKTFIMMRRLSDSSSSRARPRPTHRWGSV